MACDGVKAALNRATFPHARARTSFDTPRSMAAPDVATIRFSVQGADGQITQKCYRVVIGKAGVGPPNLNELAVVLLPPVVIVFLKAPHVRQSAPVSNAEAGILICKPHMKVRRRMFIRLNYD